MLRRYCLLSVIGLASLSLAVILVAAEPRGKAASSLARQPRTWTDVSGQFKIRAKLLEAGEEEVRLEKADGTVITVSLEKLCPADRKWIEKYGAAAKAAPASAAAGWPGFRGPNRDGKSLDTGLLKQWPDSGPKLLWKRGDIGKGFSGVAVAGSTVYITGDENEKLYLIALDLDGKPKWRVEHGPAWTGSHPGSRSTPTIDGNRLYLLSGTGQLGAFDAATGKQLWVHTAQEFQGKCGAWGYAESPLILNQMVIFRPGGQTAVAALDKETGKPVWTTRGVAALPEYGSCLAITEDKQTMIVAPTREGLLCVDARNGNVLWGNKFSASNVANCPTPIYSPPYLFWANGYGKGGVCLKLAASQATEAWTTKDMDCHHGGYIVDDGYIYGNNSNGWACIQIATGKTIWKERGVGKGSLCWADGMLYLFSEQRGQAALATCSPRGLEIRGKVQVQGEGPSWAHPVVTGGRLYLRYDQNLYCFDVKAN